MSRELSDYDEMDCEAERDIEQQDAAAAASQSSLPETPDAKPVAADDCEDAEAEKADAAADAEDEDDEASSVNDSDIVDDGDGEQPDAEPNSNSESDAGSNSDASSSGERKAKKPRRMQDESGRGHARLNFLDDIAGEDDEQCRPTKRKSTDEEEYDTGGADINEYEAEGMVSDTGSLGYETDEKERQREKSKKRLKRRRIPSDDESSGTENERRHGFKEPLTQREEVDSDEYDALLKSGGRGDTSPASFHEYADAKGASKSTRPASASARPAVKPEAKHEAKPASAKPTAKPAGAKPAAKKAQKKKLNAALLGEVFQLRAHGPSYKVTFRGVSAPVMATATGHQTYAVDLADVSHITTAVMLSTDDHADGGTYHHLLASERIAPVFIKTPILQRLWLNSRTQMTQQAFVAYADEALHYNNLRKCDQRITSEDGVVSIMQTVRQYLDEKSYTKLVGESVLDPRKNTRTVVNSSAARSAAAQPAAQPAVRPTAAIRAAAARPTVAPVDPPQFKPMIGGEEFEQFGRAAVPRPTKPLVKKPQLTKLERKPEKHSHDVKQMMQSTKEPTKPKVAKPAAALRASSLSDLFGAPSSADEKPCDFLFGHTEINTLMIDIMRGFLNSPVENVRTFFTKVKDDVAGCMARSQDAQERSADLARVFKQTPAMTFAVACMPFVSPQIAQMVRDKLEPQSEFSSSLAM